MSIKNFDGSIPEELVNQAKRGDINSLTKNLSESQKAKVNAILSDPEKQKEFLTNPQVKALMKKLGLGG